MAENEMQKSTENRTVDDMIIEMLEEALAINEELREIEPALCELRGEEIRAGLERLYSKEEELRKELDTYRKKREKETKIQAIMDELEKILELTKMPSEGVSKLIIKSRQESMRMLLEKYL